MFPLEKRSHINSKGKRVWKYSINSRFYGLARNVSGTIYHVQDTKGFIVSISRNEKARSGYSRDFREAFEFLVKYAVKPLFKHAC